MELEAMYPGVIKLGEFELPCYVLNNEERVLSQREVVKLISGGRDSGNLYGYLDARALQPYLPAKFKRKEDRNPLIFRLGTTQAHGIKGSDLIDICNAYLKARQAGVLHASAAKMAEQAEMFVAACAKTGIDAIIDEATGFEYFKRAGNLQERLKAYLQDEYREWTQTFPLQFFLQLYKLEGKTPPQPLQPYPLRFGKYIMHFVYDTLDPEIADYLRENNPEPGGVKHHHQLFNDFGYKSLQDHLMSVLGIMKASINLERLKENIATAFPNFKTTRRVRLNANKKPILEEKRRVVQTDLFDYLPTVNTPDKVNEEGKENNKEVETDFDNLLGSILKVPPMPKEKK